MSEQPRTISRRQMLRGAGGLTLALPVLPSLLPREAEAAVASKPRVVLFHQPQGGYWLHLNPPDSFATEQAEITPGHRIRWAKLRATPQSQGKVGVSRIIQADPSTLTERMLGKINLLRGVDHPNSRGHNKNGFGNTRSDGYDGDAVPSVDQLLAYSPSFYAPGEATMRSMVTGGMSISNGAPGGVSSIPDPQKLFDQLFLKIKPTDPMAPAQPAPKPAEGPVLVDALFESYKQLRDGNRRLSTADRRRLENHMAHIADLQKQLSAPTGARPVGCAPPAKPSAYTFGHKGDRLRTLAESKRLFQLYNDIFVAAFSCGVSRIAAVVPQDNDDPFSDYAGGWHELAHATDKTDPKPAEIFADSTQAFFEHVVLDLAKKLDAMEDAPGSTFLDNTLIFYTQESSWDAHNQIDRCVLTVGNVNNYFKTGHFVDYRNLDRKECDVDHAGPRVPFYTGVLVQQWWANVLEGVGIPKSEWSKYSQGTGGGYGVQRLRTSCGTRNSSLANAYLPAVVQGTGNKLPIIT